MLWERKKLAGRSSKEVIRELKAKNQRKTISQKKQFDYVHVVVLDFGC